MISNSDKCRGKNKTGLQDRRFQRMAVGSGDYVRNSGQGKSLRGNKPSTVLTAAITVTKKLTLQSVHLQRDITVRLEGIKSSWADNKDLQTVGNGKVKAGAAQVDAILCWPPCLSLIRPGGPSWAFLRTQCTWVVAQLSFNGALC